MVHAKTAVADGRWGRVGSTNLNPASWLGNCELDAVIEDADFAGQMQEQYLNDLENATEVILNPRRKVRAPGEPPHPFSLTTSGGGSAGRAAAGALRIGNAVGAAFTSRRVLHPVEARVVFIAGALLLGLALLCYFFPSVLAYPFIGILVWFGIALLYRSYKMHRKRRRSGNRHRSG